MAESAARTGTCTGFPDCDDPAVPWNIPRDAIPDMKRLLLLATVAVALPVLAETPKKGESKAKPYLLDKCLVSDEKFEGSDMKPYELVVDGQTVKLCCKSCLKDFNKDKAGYLKKLSEETAKKEKDKAKSK